MMQDIELRWVERLSPTAPAPLCHIRVLQWRKCVMVDKVNSEWTLWQDVPLEEEK